MPKTLMILNAEDAFPNLGNFSAEIFDDETVRLKVDQELTYSLAELADLVDALQQVIDKVEEL